MVFYGRGSWWTAALAKEDGLGSMEPGVPILVFGSLVSPFQKFLDVSQTESNGRNARSLCRSVVLGVSTLKGLVWWTDINAD